MRDTRRLSGLWLTTTLGIELSQTLSPFAARETSSLISTSESRRADGDVLSGTHLFRETTELQHGLDYTTSEYGKSKVV
jgi:hypothetical protein